MTNDFWLSNDFCRSDDYSAAKPKNSLRDYAERLIKNKHYYFHPLTRFYLMGYLKDNV